MQFTTILNILRYSLLFFPSFRSYKFVDIKSDEIPANQFMIEPSQVEHSISFHFLSEPHQTEKHNRKIGRQKLWKPKPKFCEDITYEDMCSVVVTGDWVLNKKGLFGKGRERRSELVTGAIHSPALKKCNNKKQTQA